MTSRERALLALTIVGFVVPNTMVTIFFVLLLRERVVRERPRVQDSDAHGPQRSPGSPVRETVVEEI